VVAGDIAVHHHGIAAVERPIDHCGLGVIQARTSADRPFPSFRPGLLSSVACNLSACLPDLT
jgi:hypothetical protein